MCKERVILLMGEDAVNKFYDSADRSTETVKYLLKSIQSWEFDTADEAEAFRMGICAVAGRKGTVECEELTKENVKGLMQILKARNQSRSVKAT